MRNTIIFTFLLLFALSISVRAQINAEITYIGNEGFMIKNNNKKLFIDALYYYTFGAGILNVDTGYFGDVDPSFGDTDPLKMLFC